MPGVGVYGGSPILSVNQEQAQTVRTIFAWFLDEDLGPWTIAQRLTDLGIPPARGGEAWNHSSVRNILRSESYTGVLNQQKWDYTDTHLNKYRAKGEKVQRRIAQLKERMTRLEYEAADSAALAAQLEAVEEVRRKVAHDIDRLYFDDRQRLIRALVKSVVLTPEVAITIHARLKSVLHLSDALALYSSR